MYTNVITSIEIQNKISAVLSSYDELIENNNKRIKLLEQMAENLYKEWFVRFRFPGYESAKFENGLPEGKKCSGCGIITVMQETTNKISCVDNNNDNKCDMCGRDLSTSDNSSTVTCDCMCHEGGFVGIIYKIVSQFWKLFRTNKTCACGINHY